MTPSASQDPDKDRSDLVALGNWSGTDSDRMDKDDRLQLPEWLEEFREHLEDQKSLCTHNTQESSNSERPHFPKDRNCDVCLRTKITRNPCRRGTGEASITEAEKFGDLITADHKVLNEGGESRNNHRYAVVVQDLATLWIQSFPCRTKLLRRRKRVYESFSNRHRSQKSFALTIHWNLANPVYNYRGITELRHVIDLRRTELRNELSEE